MKSFRGMCLVGAGLAVLLGGCRAQPKPAAQREAVKPPHTPVHVDSAVPREVALARFQQASQRAAALEGGAPSRDALVRAFVRAVEAKDTATLRRLVISRGEFAYLYYPTSAQGLPPYSLSPDLYWFMTVEQSNRGVQHLVNELGGKQLSYAGYRCQGDSTVEGQNTLWGPCLIHTRQRGGDTLSQRLFGPIVARGGQYKFLSYSNKL
jgi:hypothetical protein